LIVARYACENENAGALCDAIGATPESSLNVVRYFSAGSGAPSATNKGVSYGGADTKEAFVDFVQVC
jgi:hypothetical protein